MRCCRGRKQRSRSLRGGSAAAVWCSSEPFDCSPQSAQKTARKLWKTRFSMIASRRGEPSRRDGVGSTASLFLSATPIGRGRTRCGDHEARPWRHRRLPGDQGPRPGDTRRARSFSCTPNGGRDRRRDRRGPARAGEVRGGVVVDREPLLRAAAASGSVEAEAIRIVVATRRAGELEAPFGAGRRAAARRRR